MWIHASRRYPLIVAVTLAVLAVGGAAGSAANQAADPRPLTLRLADLPKGWKVGDDTGCGPMGVEESGPEVAALVRDFHPQVCDIEFNKVWGSAKPFYVQSLAMTFEASGGDDRAFAATPAILRYFGADGGVRAATAPAIGDASQLLLNPKANPPGPQPSPESVVVWQTGDIYAFVVAAAGTQSVATAAAIGYARAQQARIETPTPVSDADFDSLEVGLDNPKLEVPVWWLGRSWDPPGSRPPLELIDAAAGNPKPRVLPGQNVDLSYYPPRPPPGSVAARGYASIFIWKPKAWDYWRSQRVGQIGWKSPCARSKTVHVKAGRAVIWSTYWRTPKARPCPKAAPDTFFAHVYGSGYVIAVNMPLCVGELCAPRGTNTNPYATPSGLEAVVRALRRR